jgi:hypothetical protein
MLQPSSQDRPHERPGRSQGRRGERGQRPPLAVFTTVAAHHGSFVKQRRLPGELGKAVLVLLRVDAFEQQIGEPGLQWVNVPA